MGEVGGLPSQQVFVNQMFAQGGTVRHELPACLKDPGKVNNFQPPKPNNVFWQRAGLNYWNRPTAKTQEVLVNQGVLFISLSSLLNLRRIDHFDPLQLRYDVKMMVIAVKPPLVGPSYQSFMEVTQKSMQFWIKWPGWSFAKGELTWLEGDLLNNLQERKQNL